MSNSEENRFSVVFAKLADLRETDGQIFVASDEVRKEMIDTQSVLDELKSLSEIGQIPTNEKYFTGT